MAKQILIGLDAQNLAERARYLMVYFPFNEDLCLYSSLWEGELYLNKYPLVSKGMWTGYIDLKTGKLLNWEQQYGDLYLQAKVCDSGTYFLLDNDKTPICKIAGYVPNALIPDKEDCGDYIRLRIKYDGTIENWSNKPDFSDFFEDVIMVENIDRNISDEPIISANIEFTYSQLMHKLLQLPKFLQLEIGQTLVKNASEGFEDDEE